MIKDNNNNNNNNNSNNKIFFDGIVSLDNDNFDTLLTITEKDILFQKKKGIFKKRYKIVKDILISDIKVIKDKVKIEQKKNNLIIYTKDDKFTFATKNVVEAKRIVEEIYKIIFGEYFLVRNSKKGIKFLNSAKNAVEIIGGIVIAVSGTYNAIKKNKDTIQKTIKNMISFIKK